MKKLLLGICLVCSLISLASCKESKKEIGLQLYSIREEVAKDLSGSLTAVADAGYTFVEAAGYNGENGTFYGLEPKAFKEECNKHGLKLISSHINGPDPNAVSLEECLIWWDNAIAAHKLAEIPYIVQPSMWRSAYETLPGLAKYCELFNAVGEKCNAAGIRFGYHNHNREFTTTFTLEDMSSIVLYDYMLQNTDPEKVFFQIDLYWIQVGGASALDYFDKYPGRFELWHVKDDLEIGASGKIDFGAIYAQAEKSGMKYQIVEQEAFAEGLTPFESIKASRDFLQNAPYVK